MKKILLGTSALIGAVALSGAASAEDPKVTVGGFNTFEAGYTESDFDQNLRNRAFRNSTEIHFNVAGKSEAGLNYGAEIDLLADIDGNGGSSATAGQTAAGLNAHRTYAWLGGDAWGHFEMGSNDGVARTMKVDAANVARATGGIDGDWTYFADVNSKTGSGVTAVGNGSAGALAGGGSGHNTYITAPRLPVEHGPATGFANELWSNNDKLSYYSPKVSGFQLGVSYTPDINNRGQSTGRVDYLTSGTTAVRDVWEGALSYEGQFDQIGFAAAVTGESGHAVDGQSLHNLGAWNVGAKVSYMGFSLAGSYGDWDDSLTANTAGRNQSADYWTVGGAYETGPFGASVTYFTSQDKITNFKNEFQDVSVGIDYKLAPGLTPFVEWTYYDIDPSGTGTSTLDNQGNVVLVGSQLSF